MVKNCKRCSKEFRVPPSRRDQQYCSHSCANRSRAGDYTNGKMCRECKVVKPLSEFQRLNAYYASGNPIVRAYCRPCHSRIANISPNRLTVYRRRLLKEYGLTERSYADLLAAQGGRCAVCGSADPRRKGDTNFVVDHDHATGRVRGLLCHHCNRALGLFQDSEELLLKAAAYLSKARGAEL